MALAALVAPTAVKPTIAYLERLAQVKRGLLKEASRRGSMSKAATAGLLTAAARLGVGGLTADWLHFGRGDPPFKRGEMPPADAAVARSLLGDIPEGQTAPSRQETPSSVESRSETDSPPRSASVREVAAHQAAWRGFRVLAGRIARTIEQTILGNELGYTTASRAQLADSLEIFAQELDRRCGEQVCGDIWKVVAWLRKPPDGPRLERR